jgi:hypothetical protein
MPARRRKTQQLMTQAAQLAFAAPQVVAHRMTRLALAGPNPSQRDRVEFERMGQEKAQAFNESWSAMAQQALLAQQALTLSWMQSLCTPGWGAQPTAAGVAAQLHGAALGVLGKGMAPVHRRAVANARRLARTKLR